jgi:hypothetical protein
LPPSSPALSPISNSFFFFFYKLNSGKPQEVLNFSYKLGEVTQSTTTGYAAPNNSSSATYAQPPSAAAYPPASVYPPSSAYPPAGKADAYPPPPAAKTNENLQTIASSFSTVWQWVWQHV